MCLKPTGGFYRLPIKFSAGEGILLAPPKRQRINVDLLNQKIIVTGAARGMGAATVRAYVKAGATVYAMDIANDAGAQMTENANKLGPGTAHYMPVDVAERESVERAFATAYQQMGGLDVLAHPAAIQRSSDASTVTEQEWGRYVHGQCARNNDNQSDRCQTHANRGRWIDYKFWLNFRPTRRTVSRCLLSCKGRGSFLDPLSSGKLGTI